MTGSFSREAIYEAPQQPVREEWQSECSVFKCVGMAIDNGE